MENTTDIEEKAETTLNQTDEKPQETYRVLEFVRGHAPGSATILSALIATTAFILNLISYAYQRLKLQPWHIGGEVIDYWGSGQVYITLVVDMVYYGLKKHNPKQ